MKDSIVFFQKLASTKTFRKLLLNPLDKDCDKDGNVLDIVINKYINPNLKVCPKCILKSTVANKFLDKVATGLTLSPDEFKQELKNPSLQRGLKAVVRGIKNYGFQKPFLPAAPFLVVWHLTNLCNLRCKHCYQTAGKKSKDELTFKQQLKVIDKLSDWGITYLAFSGGEPLLHPDFFKLVEYTTKKGIAASIATNGTLVTKEIAKKLLDAGIVYAEVSLNSLDFKEHDEFRGLEGAWEKSVRGIENLIEVGISTCIASFIHKNNYKKIPEYVEFTKKLGAKFWIMVEYKPAGRGKVLDIDMSPEEREESLEILTRLTLNEIKNKKENNPFIYLSSTAPQFGRKMKEVSEGEYEIGGHYGFLINNSLLFEIFGGCAAGRAYICLHQNGDITPCVYITDLIVGNVLTDNLDYLWSNNQIFKDCRNGDRFYGFCPECEYKYICGGCRARAYGYFRDITKPDIGCIYNKKYLEK